MMAPAGQSDSRAPFKAVDLAVDRFTGYVGPLGWMRTTVGIGGAAVPWSRTRFVPGVGAGFVGIWDREHPGPAVERFTQSPRGASQLWDRLAELQEPERLRNLGLDVFGGFRTLPRAAEDMSVAWRPISLARRRFVYGHGDGFVGVWDRLRPGAPIARYAQTEEGESQAFGEAHSRMFEETLSRQRLSDRRLFVPWREPTLLQLPWPAAMSEQMRASFEDRGHVRQRGV
jgi:hypothetical protein